MARIHHRFITAFSLSIAVLLIGATYASAQIGVAGTLDKLKMQNYLRQIALQYNQYFATVGRAPQTTKDFLVYIKRSAPEIKNAIEKKHIVVVMKIRRLQSKSVLAYQREANRTGGHLVVMGDRTIQSMTTAQLKNALKR